MGVFHTGFATLLAQHDESFVDVTHFDASKCSEDGFDKGDLIRRKGRGIALVVRTLVGGVYKPLVPQHIGKWLRIYSYSAMNPRKADQKQLKITVSEDVY
ncbi:MAG: hypothetical protein LH660_00105, partial [Phormidesmis sp. CAN_BIN36]|nr:hypothetical protein [Phormidesmis sp. CAN_BIN36]